MLREQDHNQSVEIPQHVPDRLGLVMRSYLQTLLEQSDPEIIQKRHKALEQKLVAQEETIGDVFNKQLPVTINRDQARFLKIEPKVTIEYATALEPHTPSRRRAVVDYYYVQVRHDKPLWYVDQANNTLWTPKESCASLIHVEPPSAHDKEEAHIWFADIEERPLSQVDAYRRNPQAFPQRHVPVGEAEDDDSPEAKEWIKNLLEAVAQATGTEETLKKCESSFLPTQ